MGDLTSIGNLFGTLLKRGKGENPKIIVQTQENDKQKAIIACRKVGGPGTMTDAKYIGKEEKSIFGKLTGAEPTHKWECSCKKINE